MLLMNICFDGFLAFFLVVLLPWRGGRAFFAVKAYD
jgi:hypothetical protein